MVTIPPFPYYIGDRGDGYGVEEALLDPDSLWIVLPQLFFQCTVRPLQARADGFGRCPEDILLDLIFFSAFEDLRLQMTGTMEPNGVRKVYEPSPILTLYVGRVEDLLGRVPLIPCFLDGNATSTIPHKYANRQRTAFECGCADGAGPALRKGSHVYEINTWLWAFGRPQPRNGGLSVAKTQRIRKESRSEASKRGWETKRAQKCSAEAP